MVIVEQVHTLSTLRSRLNYRRKNSWIVPPDRDHSRDSRIDPLRFSRPDSQLTPPKLRG